MKKYLVDCAYLTDIGSVRIINEVQTQIVKNDSDDILMIVADGMGGCNRGDYASKVTVDIITNEFKIKKFIFKFMIKFLLRSLINKINRIIFENNENSKIYFNYGTTVIIAIIHKNNLIITNVEILNSNKNAIDKITELIKKANFNGGSDNITATLLIRKLAI